MSDTTRDTTRDATRDTHVPPMTPDRWRAVDAVLQAALACDAGARDAFVAEACADDEALRHEVASLLAAHDVAADDFLERPAVIEASGTAPAPLAERLSGALAGRYAIEREVARGGMAVVFAARDLRHDRRVAIKVMRDEVSGAVGAERFLEEIRVTASLQHPHVLPLFDSGTAGGLLWYAMPFADGETLRARLARERRLPVDEAVRIAREIADALQYAHGRGVVHRDIKPENVLLQESHALVADFGIALALERAGGERLTRTGLSLGTPQYMSPEQATAEKSVDARADVYALGAVLHEMLAGEPPFVGSHAVVLQRMLREPPRALATYRGDVPAAVDDAVRRALAKRPSERFATAADFSAALVAPHQPARTPPAEARRAPRRVVSARAALYATALATVVGLAGGWALARASVLDDVARFARERVKLPVVAAPVVTAPAQSDGDLSLVVVDRAGNAQRTIAADRPWTPRISPDGRRVAYGAFGPGRGTSDVWIADLDGGTTRRLTDDDADGNDPQWSPDGKTIAYSASAPGGKDIMSRPAAGGEAHLLASRDGTQFPSDWLRDGSALLVTDNTAADRRDVLVQPVDGSPAHAYVATAADETAARVSPDGRWIAYTSDESGRSEVYLDSYPRPGRRVAISHDGGAHPVWRGDGRELYYWRDDALVAVQLAPPSIGAETVLFRAPYAGGLNTMYDASPDGSRFVIVRRR